jgi:hypothetical protein
MTAPQVEPDHYAWGTYEYKGRWISYWHQVNEVIAAGATSCVEIGPGTGTVRRTLEAQGVAMTTVDIDGRLGVDRVGDVCELPCADGEFDAVLCAQVLEHVPWDRVPFALAELARVAHTAVVSVPQSGREWRVHIKLPAGPPFERLGRFPARAVHQFDGQHYWQVGARGTRWEDLRRLMRAEFTIGREYTVPENLYHRFYILTSRAEDESTRSPEALKDSPT